MRHATWCLPNSSEFGGPKRSTVCRPNKIFQLRVRFSNIFKIFQFWKMSAPGFKLNLEMPFYVVSLSYIFLASFIYVCSPSFCFYFPCAFSLRFPALKFQIHDSCRCSVIFMLLCYQLATPSSQFPRFPKCTTGTSWEHWEGICDSLCVT